MTDRMVFAAVCGASRKLKEINQRWFASVVLRRSAAVQKTPTKSKLRRLCGHGCAKPPTPPIRSAGPIEARRRISGTGEEIDWFLLAVPNLTVSELAKAYRSSPQI
jgi:hypothetical protein